eukprot:4212674-Pleurochrysis_carterae.AAC.1
MVSASPSSAASESSLYAESPQSFSSVQSAQKLSPSSVPFDLPTDDRDEPKAGCPEPRASFDSDVFEFRENAAAAAMPLATAAAAAAD